MFFVPFPRNMTVRKGAELLQQFINNANLPDGAPVQIIGYSKGGLIAYDYLNLNNGIPVRAVQRVIALGTPFHGSPLADFMRDGFVTFERSIWTIFLEPTRAYYLSQLDGFRRDVFVPALLDLTRSAAEKNFQNWTLRPGEAVTFSGQACGARATVGGDCVVPTSSSTLEYAQNLFVSNAKHCNLPDLDPPRLGVLADLAEKPAMSCRVSQIANEPSHAFATASQTTVEAQSADVDMRILLPGITDTLTVVAGEDSITEIAFGSVFQPATFQVIDPLGVVAYSGVTSQEYVGVSLTGNPPGVWKIVATASESAPADGEFILAGVQVLDPLVARLDIEVPVPPAHPTIREEVSASNGDSIGVTCSVLIGSNPPVDLMMHDDGVPPDSMAGDFIFTGTAPIFSPDDTVRIAARMGGRHGGRLFTRILSSMVLGDYVLPVAVPTTGLQEGAIELAAPQPNPSSQATRIVYSLGAQALVELTISDLQGRRMTTLVKSLQAAGRHSADWNGLDQRGNTVPAGLYFARLRVGSVVRSTKLVLTR